MRFLKVFFGLAVVVAVLAGCGGESDSTPATSSSASTTAPTSSSDPTSSSTGSSGSSSSTSPSTGSGSSSSPPPASSSGTATLSWAAPTTNSDGSALTDLAGYHIHYGTSASSLSSEITVSSPSTVTYQLTNLATGTWYFAVTSYTTSGLESPLSSIVSKTIS